MKTAKKVTKKSRGRPATGKGIQIGERWSEGTLHRIDEWRRKEADLPGRPEAIRRLVEMGLSMARPRPASRTRGRKAHEMAGKQLDKLADQSATTEEQASRKRRLLKGPEEFRGVRVDRPGQIGRRNRSG